MYLKALKFQPRLRARINAELGSPQLPITLGVCLGRHLRPSQCIDRAAKDFRVALAVEILHRFVNEQHVAPHRATAHAQELGSSLGAPVAAEGDVWRRATEPLLISVNLRLNPTGFDAVLVIEPGHAVEELCLENPPVRVCSEPWTQRRTCTDRCAAVFCSGLGADADFDGQATSFQLIRTAYQSGLQIGLEPISYSFNTWLPASMRLSQQAVTEDVSRSLFRR